MPARKLSENKKQENKDLKERLKNFSELGEDYLILQELSKIYPYSQEYLSLLARHGKINAKKLGRNWYTTRKEIDNYLEKQGLTVILPAPASYKGKISKPVSILPEQIASVKSKKAVSVDTQDVQKTITEGAKKVLEKQKEIDEKFDNNLKEEKNFFKVLVDKLHSVDQKSNTFASHIKKPHEKLSQDEHEFIEMGSRGAFYKFKKFNKESKKHLRSTTKNLLLMISAIILIFLIVGGISFGNVDPIMVGIKKAFKDATTIQGHSPGTHSDEVLLLDENGNVSIYGHIETKGQLRSWVKDGIAPIVVDSTTMIQNLNAEMLGGLKGEDFTLAFVSKNGNVTTEDVFLEGNVEVGKTLLVKGATKLLDSLLVNGSLGVWGDIIGKGNLKISGTGFFGKAVTIGEELTIGGDLNTQGHNLNLGIGTISTTNTKVIPNLNADMVDSMNAEDFTLDYVVRQGNETSQKIKIGGLEVTGVSNFDSMTFHNDGLWATDGSFSRSLGVGGFFSAAGPITLGDGSEKVIVNGNNWQVGEDGAMTIGAINSGAITASGDISVTEDLDVGGDLTVAGSFTGATTASFDDIIANTLWLKETPVTTTSPSFLMQTTDVADDWATGSATFMGINASSSFLGNFVDLRIDNTSKFFIDELGNVGIAGVGQFGGATTVSYSRFG